MFAPNHRSGLNKAMCCGSVFTRVFSARPGRRAAAPGSKYWLAATQIPPDNHDYLDDRELAKRD